MAGIETSVVTDSTSILAQSMEPMNAVLQVIFTVECGTKILAENVSPWLYFHDSWNSFDFLIVIVTYLSDLIPFNVIFFRLIRLFRIMKLIKRLPRLQTIVNSCLNSFTSIVIVIIMFILYLLIIGQLGIYLFSENDPFHFGDQLRSFLSLFQVVTFDNYSDIMYVNMYGCDVFSMDASGIVDWHSQYCRHPKPQFLAAALFFTFNVIVGGFLGTTLVCTLYIFLSLSLSAMRRSS